MNRKENYFSSVNAYNTERWKKTIIGVLFFVMLFSLSFCDTTGQYSAITAKAETTVYITRTGSKYHTHKCGNGTFYPTTLSDAKARGLSACSKCFPNGSPSSSSPAKTTASKATVKKENIKINKTSKQMVAGQSYRLKITGTSQKVQWSSSHKKVAVVTANGKVTAKAKGKSTITAKVGNNQKKCVITVETPKLSNTVLIMKPLQSVTLKLSGCKHAVNWSTNDSYVAKVSKGKVKAVDVGTATIRATVHGKSYTCKVKVVKPAVENISISETNVSMNYNAYKELLITTSPKNVLDYYDVQVTSSNEEIVYAWEDEGTIQLISLEKEGTAVITVTVGGVTQSIPVTVVPPELGSYGICSIFPAIYRERLNL